MEEKLMNEFESFCKFNCRYGKELEIEIFEDCTKCGEAVRTSYAPCDYCQIEEFIREIRDRI